LRKKKEKSEDEEIIKSNNLRSLGSLSACHQRGYNTDDNVFNIRNSFNSMNMNNSTKMENNSNIFVVSRDNGSRFKTDFYDSDDSEIKENSFEERNNTHKKNENKGNDDGNNNDEFVFNTPTKRKILTSYS